MHGHIFINYYIEPDEGGLRLKPNKQPNNKKKKENKNEQNQRRLTIILIYI